MRSHQLPVYVAVVALAWGWTNLARAGSSDAPAVRDARKRLAEAESQVHKAKLAMSAATAKIRKEIEGTPQWKQAAAAAREAQGAFTSVAKAVRDRVSKEPAYKSAAAVRDQRRAERDALRVDPKTPQDKVIESAVAVLNAESAVRRIEQQAMEKDPAAVESKRQMNETNAKLAELRKTFDDKAAQDPDYQSAKQQLETASSQFADARKQLSEAQSQQAAAQDQQLDQELEAKKAQMRRAAGFGR